MRLTCPLCGPRDRREFYYYGDAVWLDRPGAEVAPEAWHDYIHFKAAPASGWCMAHLMATDQPHVVARRFRLDRFATGHVLDEEGTGSRHNLH